MTKRAMRPGLKRCLPLLLASGWFTLAWGDTRSDPTAPPPGWSAAQGNARGPAATANQEVPSGLELILIGPARRFAIVDGKVVTPGEIYNGSPVLAIKRDEVVVQDASKSLKLTPGIEKKVVAPAPPKRSRGAAPRRRVRPHGCGDSR